MPRIYSIQAETEEELVQFNLNAVREAGSNLSGVLTEYPVEDGGFVSDHYIVAGERVQVNGCISDIRTFGSKGIGPEGDDDVSYVVNDTTLFINKLKKLIQQKVPFSVQLGHGIINDLYVVSFSERQNSENPYYSSSSQTYEVAIAFQQARFATRARKVRITDDESAALALEKQRAIASQKQLKEAERKKAEDTIKKRNFSGIREKTFFTPNPFTGQDS